MHYLILKQPVSCSESKPGPSNHKLFGPGSLGLNVTKKKKGTLTYFMASLCPIPSGYLSSSMESSTKGTSLLCLEATSFSPMGSEAIGGILVPLLFLCLGGMLCEGISFSLFFTQSPVKSPKCESAFSLALRPKDHEPNSCSWVDWALIHHS